MIAIAGPFALQNTYVNADEAAWVQAREEKIKTEWNEYLQRLGFNATDFPTPPRIGIATRYNSARVHLMRACDAACFYYREAHTTVKRHTLGRNHKMQMRERADACLWRSKTVHTCC